MKRTALFLALVAAAHAAGRITVSLDGDWEMADSVSGAELPRAWEHRAPVPGLADLAFPPFADVGAFDSRELIKWQVEEQKLLPLSALIKHVGIPRQQRNYFWYRRAFTTPARRQIALLKVNKAQFGAAVWLNGRKIGEHLGCFTAGYFNLTPAVRWNGANELVVRIGVHPAAPDKDASGFFQRADQAGPLHQTDSSATLRMPGISPLVRSRWRSRRFSSRSSSDSP